MSSALHEVINLKDWNGPDTVPASPAAVTKAKKFIQFLSNLNEAIPTPFIGPAAGGGISFEWDGASTKGKEIVIFFLPDEPISYVAANPSAGYERSGETEHLQDLQQHLAWLVSTK
jgi:hypothetical protein